MADAIYWFRNDLRLTDHPALEAAARSSDELLLVYVRSTAEKQPTRWGFPRWSNRRRAFRDQSLRGLQRQIEAAGNRLVIVDGQPVDVLPSLARRVGATTVYCEQIAAPEEMAEVAALRAAGIEVEAKWQSSLLDPRDLPFPMADLPATFTAFRQAVERANCLPRPAAGAVQLRALRLTETFANQTPPAATPTDMTWYAFSDPRFDGSEASALSHLERYFGSAAPQTYKATRNGLSGIDYSTKFSPWLATGALSPRTVYATLKAHEARQGANESTYWIWFELLWRDYFRFSSLKHGALLFHPGGLRERPTPAHDPGAFARWCAGTTGQAFVDAGMRELEATGYLSNRLRQVVASFLVNDLDCDWRAGAAWFESRLIDYDVCSNQGNWLYVAGRGADPREGRRFDPERQAAQYDPGGAYRARWVGRLPAPLP